DLDRGDPQPLLVPVEDAFYGLAAGARAPHVGVVDEVDAKAHQLAPPEAGLHHEEVGKVTRSQLGVVQQQRVAWTQGWDWKGAKEVADSEVHGAHVAGAVGTLSGHAALRIEEGDREVLAFPGLDRVGGALHGRADLDADRLQRAPDDAKRNWPRTLPRARGPREACFAGWEVGGVPGEAGGGGHETSRLPWPSTTALTPGGRTVVDSRSSTMRGPSSVWPGASRDRSKTTVSV